MLLYNTGIYAYGALIRIASLFNTKARLWVRGRKNIIGRVEEAMAGDRSQKVWIHAASLGEFEQGRPVIEAVKAQYPQYKIVLTFFSPSGYEVRKNYDGADYIFYLPLDTPRNARRFVSVVDPQISVFVKYEFWLNYLKQLRKSPSRTYLISAIFRRKSIFFKPYGASFRRALRSFDTIFVQNRESVDLLAGIGMKNVEQAGDTRFDRVLSIVSSSRTLPAVEDFARDAGVVVAGSTWPADDDILIEAMRAYPDFKFIIAPHEIHPAYLRELIERSGRRGVLYTEVSGNTDLAACDLLVIDTIGILSSVYKYGMLGYIGGGFGAGIHNTLEAATFGLPLAFGPNYKKFKEAADLISNGAARSVGGAGELNEWMSSMAANESLRKQSAETARNYVAENAGATSLIIGSIFG